MDIKLYLVIGSAVVSVAGSFYWVKFQTQKNTEDIIKLKNEILDKLNMIVAQNNDKLQSSIKLYETKLNEHDKKIEAGFKKVDKFEERISKLETKTTHFLTYDKSKDLHPTKESFEVILKNLQDTDNSLSNEIKDFKKEINKKLENIVSKLEEHMKEDRENQNQILTILKGKK